jgi:hypothetical protein
MSRPGLEPGPPAWEASTLEKSHVDSLYAGYSEPLLMMSLLHPDLYMAPVFSVQRVWRIYCPQTRTLNINILRDNMFIRC